MIQVAVCGVGRTGSEVLRAVLDSDAHAEEVRAAVRHWQQLGINGVPAVVIDQRHLISGAQPAATYERALRSLAAQDPGPQA